MFTVQLVVFVAILELLSPKRLFTNNATKNVLATHAPANWDMCQKVLNVFVPFSKYYRE